MNNVMNDVVELRGGLVHRPVDVLALPHFVRTERALGRCCRFNEVCSFSSSFLETDSTNLFLSVRRP
jgi:hypothetical protein